MTTALVPTLQSYIDPTYGSVLLWGGLLAPGDGTLVGTTNSSANWSKFDFQSGDFLANGDIPSSVEVGNFESMCFGEFPVFYSIYGPGNCVGWSEWSAAGGFSHIVDVGTPSAFLDFPNNVYTYNTLVAIGSDVANWLVMPSAINQNNLATWIAETTASANSQYLFPEGGTTSIRTSCAGPVSGEQAIAYSLVAGGSTPITSGAIFRTTMLGSESSSEQIGLNFTAVAIDATWTNIDSIIGPAWDQTDGNALLIFATTDSVTNQQYVVKISVETGDVLWATPISSTPLNSEYSMTRAVIAHSVFFVYSEVTSSTGNVYVIDTTNGSATVYSTSGLELMGQQVSNDVYSCIFAQANWSSEIGDLAFLNSTPEAFSSGSGTLVAVYLVSAGKGKHYVEII